MERYLKSSAEVESWYLAQSEYNVLVIFVDIVHAGMVPGSDMVLGDVSVRSVTLVVSLARIV